MPDPSRPAGRGLPSRRSVLAVGTLGAMTSLTGCGVRVGAPERPAEPSGPGPDELARDRVARDADALRTLATRAAALVPARRALLRAVAADHSAHAKALRPAATTAPPTSTPATSPVLTAATALSVLVRAERAAATAATAELGRVSGDVARLLASIATSRALHVTRLGAGSAGGSR